MRIIWYEVEAKDPLEIDFLKDQRRELIQALKLKDVYDPYWEDQMAP